MLPQRVIPAAWCDNMVVSDSHLARAHENEIYNNRISDNDADGDGLLVCHGGARQVVC